jgi:acyl-CoA synthetase (AMP-forming)/AMP-acid ligase II
VSEIPRSPSGKLLRRVLVDAERARAASAWAAISG